MTELPFLRDAYQRDVDATADAVDGNRVALDRTPHVRTTDEIGRIEVLKTESKGTGNNRIRLRVVDA